MSANRSLTVLPIRSSLSRWAMMTFSGTDINQNPAETHRKPPTRQEEEEEAAMKMKMTMMTTTMRD